MPWIRDGEGNPVTLEEGCLVLDMNIFNRKGLLLSRVKFNCIQLVLFDDVICNTPLKSDQSVCEVQE